MTAINTAIKQHWTAILGWSVAAIFAGGVLWGQVKGIPRRVLVLEEKAVVCERNTAVVVAKLDLILKYLEKR